MLLFRNVEPFDNTSNTIIAETCLLISGDEVGTHLARARKASNLIKSIQYVYCRRYDGSIPGRYGGIDISIYLNSRYDIKISIYRLYRYDMQHHLRHAFLLHTCSDKVRAHFLQRVLSEGVELDEPVAGHVHVGSATLYGGGVERGRGRGVVKAF